MHAHALPLSAPFDSSGVALATVPASDGAAVTASWQAFAQAIAPLRVPPGLAATALVSPRLVQAWAQVLVMHWSRLERLGGLSLCEPLYLLDLAPGDGALASGVLSALQRELHAHGMVGWPVRYLLCPLNDEVASPAAQRPELQAFAARGWLDHATWTARSGQPLLLGASRFPLFGARNPVVALCAGGLSELPMQLYGTHFGALMQARASLGSADETHGSQAVALDWQDITSAELRAASSTTEAPEVALLEHYRASIPSAPILLSEASLAMVDALASFSAGRYLLLACDCGVTQEAQIRQGALGIPDQGLAGQVQLAVNFHALAWHQQHSGARAANLQCGDMAAVVHLACRDERLELDQEAWQSLLDCADQGHPADRWWLTHAAPCHAVDHMSFQLRNATYDPWALRALLDDLERGPEQDFAPASQAAIHDLRRSLGRGWRNLAAPQRDGALQLALTRLAFRLGDWSLAREVLGSANVGIAECPQLELQRAHLAVCTGSTPTALAHLARYVAQAPQDTWARELQERLHWRQTHRQGQRGHPVEGLQDGDLRLELLDEFHIGAWLHQYRDPSIAQQVGLPTLQTPQQALDYLNQIAQGDAAEYAVMHRELGFVGAVGLHSLGDMAHIHFWMGADHQGQGLGTRAAALLCQALRDGAMKHAFTSVHQGNPRSERLLLRIGFEPLPYKGEGGDAEYIFLHLALCDQALGLATHELQDRIARLCQAINQPLIHFEGEPE